MTGERICGHTLEGPNRPINSPLCIEHDRDGPKTFNRYLRKITLFFNLWHEYFISRAVVPFLTVVFVLYFYANSLHKISNHLSWFCICFNLPK